MRHQGSAFARLAVLTAVTGGLILGGGPAQAAPKPEVPILGQGVGRSKLGPGPVLVSLHGVRRVGDATVVYWSTGYTPDASTGDGVDIITSFGLGAVGADRDNRDPAADTSDVAVVDMEGLKAYTTVFGPQDTCLCTDSSAVLPYQPKAGKAYVMYAVLPKLPEDLDTATVKLAGKVFPHVPIEDGAMTPEKPRNASIVVGKGWPKADPGRIDKVKNVEKFIYPVSENSKILDSAVATRDEGAQTQIDIAADVLFTFDKASLTSKAKKEIKTAADQIRKAKPKGTITITGHTDAEGAKNYNQKLSERRAESVATEIKPLLPKGVDVATEGKGETEPIASNDSDEGKAKNRRVTITIPGGDK